MFAVPWFLQIMWVFITAFPVLIVLSNPSNSQPDLSWSDFLGLAVWIIGFSIEVVADNQKQKFKSVHPDDFISVGLYAYSRYPNYFGEVLLWAGVWISATAGFTENWQFVSIFSPIFEFFLIYFVSGVAISERSALKRYGHRQDFIEYKKRTSIFIPWFQKRN